MRPNHTTGYPSPPTEWDVEPLDIDSTFPQEYTDPKWQSIAIRPNYIATIEKYAAEGEEEKDTNTIDESYHVDFSAMESARYSNSLTNGQVRSMTLAINNGIGAEAVAMRHGASVEEMIRGISKFAAVKNNEARDWDHDNTILSSLSLTAITTFGPGRELQPSNAGLRG